MADYLGDLHDIDIFIETVEKEGEIPKEEKYQLLRQFLAVRRKELVELSKPLGEKIYSESPKNFVSRMKNYYESWKKTDTEKKNKKDTKKKDKNNNFFLAGNDDVADNIFSLKKKSKKSDFFYCSFFGKYPCSPLHDLPLFTLPKSFSFFVDTSKNELLPFRLSLDSPLTPLVKSSTRLDSPLPFNSGK